MRCRSLPSFLRSLVWAVCLLLCSVAYAGYSARITAITLASGQTWGYATQYANYAPWEVPTASSGCFMAPSMGIVSQVAQYTYFPVYVDSIDAVGNWAGRAGYGLVVAVAGTYGVCNASPSGGSLPVFTGSASDPVVSGVLSVGGGAGSGGGGGSGGGSAEPFDPVLAGGVFAFFFVGVAGTWLLSQNIGLILSAIKKW